MILINLIYYYPPPRGAPDNVAQHIFKNLLVKKEQLPFDEIMLFTAPKFKKHVENKFEGITVFSNKDIFRINKCIVHIPISPFFFPNSKFLLHMIAKIRNNKLILNYHGDILNEMMFKLKYDHKLGFVGIPTCMLLPVLLSSPNKLVVNSYILADLVKKRYGVKSVVIPNAIDDYWFSKEYEQLSKDNEVIEIFYH